VGQRPASGIAVVSGWTVWGISVISGIWVTGGSSGDGLLLDCAPKCGNDTQSGKCFYIFLIQSIRAIFRKIGEFGPKYFCFSALAAGSKGWGTGWKV
jgi:hypothetical protein